MSGDRCYFRFCLVNPQKFTVHVPNRSFLDRLMRRKVPASVFVTMNPQMQAVRIAVEKKGTSVFRRLYTRTGCRLLRSSVVPDHTLLHLTFRQQSDSVSPSTTNEYFWEAPALSGRNTHPRKPAVSAPGAAFRTLERSFAPLSGRAAGTADGRSIPEIYDALCPTAPDDAPLYRSCNLFARNLTLFSRPSKAGGP